MVNNMQMCNLRQIKDPVSHSQANLHAGPERHPYVPMVSYQTLVIRDHTPMIRYQTEIISLVQNQIWSPKFWLPNLVSFLLYICFKEYAQYESNDDVIKYYDSVIWHNWDMCFEKFRGLPTMVALEKSNFQGRYKLTFTPQPSGLEGYCRHGPDGRLGGRLPNLRNPYLCNHLTDFLHSKFCGIV